MVLHAVPKDDASHRHDDERDDEQEEPALRLEGAVVPPRAPVAVPIDEPAAADGSNDVTDDSGDVD